MLGEIRGGNMDDITFDRHHATANPVVPAMYLGRFVDPRWKG